jgi:hypothetical protein
MVHCSAASERSQECNVPLVAITSTNRNRPPPRSPRISPDTPAAADGRQAAAGAGAATYSHRDATTCSNCCRSRRDLARPRCSKPTVGILCWHPADHLDRPVGAHAELCRHCKRCKAASVKPGRQRGDRRRRPATRAKAAVRIERAGKTVLRVSVVSACATAITPR